MIQSNVAIISLADYDKYKKMETQIADGRVICMYDSYGYPYNYFSAKEFKDKCINENHGLAERLKSAESKFEALQKEINSTNVKDKIEQCTKANIKNMSIFEFIKLKLRG